MGLDMYICEVDKNNVSVDENLLLENENINLFKKEEFFYWRKHPDLHGWFFHLYLTRGGNNVEFNGVPVVVAKEDVLRLEEDLNDGLLPKTSGFFFGESDPYKIEQTRSFIKRALDYYEKNKDSYLVYTSSW